MDFTSKWEPAGQFFRSNQLEIMKRFTITLWIMGICASSFAQSFSALKNSKDNNPMLQNGFKVYVRHTSVVSKYTPNYSGVTVNVGFRSDEYKKGGTRIRYENPTLGDFLSRIPDMVKTTKAIVNDTKIDATPKKWEDHGHGGGLLGWVQYYFNAVAKDKFLLSPGFSAGDYIYGSRYEANGQNKADMDPYGYFFAGGPAIMASYLPTNKFWIDGYVNYDIAFAKVNNRGTAGYQKPHFLTLGADLYTSTKLFGGIRLNRMIDRGISNDKSTRLDISVGFGL
jgi:hypothetical protein